MGKLSISNVVRVSLLQALRGLANVNTSALAIITNEEPIPANFGVYRTYRDPVGVANDFGSDSDAFRLATMIFNQTPNIISGGGFLQIIPRLQAAPATPATLLSSGPVNLLELTATNYALRAAVNGAAAAEYDIGEIDLSSIAAAEDSLNSSEVTAAGLEFILSGELSSAQVTLRSISTGATAAVVLSDLTGAGTDILPLLKLSGSAGGTAAGLESIKDTILRTAGSVDYFGIVYNTELTDAEITATAPVVQALDRLQFIATADVAQIADAYTTVKESGFTQTRCLYHSVSTEKALDFAAGYASRGLSINFDGTNTALTMHLKDIIGLVADSGMSQTILDNCQRAGVDAYPDFGVPKVFTSGANQFFDQTYTRLAFKLRLQIAGFNFLATVGTKIPQTEEGMSALKAAYRAVCLQFVTAGVFAPGAWTGAVPFGTPEDFTRNIKDAGFYLYSQPVALQAQASREARVAPVVSIAAKDAGAIHSSDVTVIVQA